jgi:L-threonylcarbamoyladenylate synthase
VKTRVLKSTDEGSLELALEIVQRGGVVALPTDTVYGIGANAFNDDAVLNLYRVKGRSPDLAIPILISELDQIGDVAKEVPPSAMLLAETFWPGPLTLVMAKGEKLAAAVSASATVGIRMPDNDWARHLFKLAGPMAVTSANLSGEQNNNTAGEVMEVMRGRIDLVIDGGVSSGGIPSTVVDCSKGAPVKILRTGPVSQEQIEHLFADQK